MFKLFSHNNIDKAKWDACIEHSSRPSVYAISWYLDAVSPEWMGLIKADYTEVIPICWRKKWGVKYVYQPPYTQFGGLFSTLTDQIDFSPSAGLLKDQFKLIEIRINPTNHTENADYVYAKGINQYVHLNAELSEIENTIHPTHRKNIRRAQKAGIETQEIDAAEFIKFKFNNQGDYEEDINQLPDLIGVLQQKNAVSFYGAFNEAKEMVSAIMLIEYQNRSILITSATCAEGKESKAMFLLIKNCFERYVGKDHIFDFAGSSLAGVYEFNKGFGAHEEVIHSLRINNLPPLLKFLKR